MKRLAQLILFVLSCVAIGVFGVLAIYTSDWRAAIAFMVYVVVAQVLYSAWIRGK